MCKRRHNVLCDAGVGMMFEMFERENMAYIQVFPCNANANGFHWHNKCIEETKKKSKGQDSTGFSWVKQTQ